MNIIQPRLHLVIVTIITFFLLVILFCYRRKMLSGNKWLFYYGIIFLSIYFIVVSVATYQDLSLKLALQNFDLNGNGFFDGEEITFKQNQAMTKLYSDTARTLSPITDLMLAATVTIAVVLVKILFDYFKLQTHSKHKN